MSTPENNSHGLPVFGRKKRGHVPAPDSATSWGELGRHGTAFKWAGGGLLGLALLSMLSFGGGGGGLLGGLLGGYLAQKLFNKSPSTMATAANTDQKSGGTAAGGATSRGGFGSTAAAHGSSGG